MKASPKNNQSKIFTLDASKESLGRLAVLAAKYLIGKHKTIYTSNIDSGDSVVIINSDKLILTGKKRKEKKYFRHSWYPGNLRISTAKKKEPIEIIKHAIAGMLPKNRLRLARLKRLTIKE